MELACSATPDTVGGTTSLARNVISGNADGIVLQGTSDTIEGNYIGTDITGESNLGNTNVGVFIFVGAAGNIIGGTTAGDRNVISGNSEGVFFRNGPSQNVIEGDFIGTDAGGRFAIGNSIGILSENDPSANTIGGNVSGAGNVISGNTTGIDLSTNSLDWIIQGNFIGTDSEGEGAVGNRTGIVVSDGTGDVIGGSASTARNIIAGNTADGLIINGGTMNVVVGDYIGPNIGGIVGPGNGGVGIQLADGATFNLIGALTTASRNIISGNTGGGVLITGAGTDDNNVQDDFIGTTVTGMTALGNTGFGVEIAGGASDNTIGGDVNDSFSGFDNGQRDLISGNLGAGVIITGTGTTGNKLYGDFIGYDSQANPVLGNRGDGVDISNGASGNTVGSGAFRINSHPPFTIFSVGFCKIADSTGDGIFISQGSINIVQDTTIQNNSKDGAEDPGRGHGNSSVQRLTGITDNAIDGVEVLNSPSNKFFNDTMSGNAQVGIEIAGSSAKFNLLQKDHIGDESAPRSFLAQPNETGIAIVSSASHNTIGGLTTAFQSNIIAGNLGDGIFINTGKMNILEGNFIGSATGSASFAADANLRGIVIQNGVGNIIGGSTNVVSNFLGTHSAFGNLIEGNHQEGVVITGSDSKGNKVEGNLIGQGNGGADRTGIVITGGAHSNTIGGSNFSNLPTPSRSSVPRKLIIFGNTGDGIFISSRNGQHRCRELHWSEFRGTGRGRQQVRRGHRGWGNGQRHRYEGQRRTRLRP